MFNEFFTIRCRLYLNKLQVANLLTVKYTLFPIQGDQNGIPSSKPDIQDKSLPATFLWAIGDLFPCFREIFYSFRDIQPFCAPLVCFFHVFKISFAVLEIFPNKVIFRKLLMISQSCELRKSDFIFRMNCRTIIIILKKIRHTTDFSLSNVLYELKDRNVYFTTIALYYIINSIVSLHLYKDGSFLDNWNKIEWKIGKIYMLR